MYDLHVGTTNNGKKMPLDLGDKMNTSKDAKEEDNVIKDIDTVTKRMFFMSKSWYLLS